MLSGSEAVSADFPGSLWRAKDPSEAKHLARQSRANSVL